MSLWRWRIIFERYPNTETLAKLGLNWYKPYPGRFKKYTGLTIELIFPENIYSFAIIDNIKEYKREILIRNFRHKVYKWMLYNDSGEK